MRLRPTITILLLAGLGLGLSACYYAPAPGYYGYDSSYYNSGYYYGAPAYYSAPAYSAPAYYGGYYGPSVGFYYGGGWNRDRDRWH